MKKFITVLILATSFTIGVQASPYPLQIKVQNKVCDVEYKSEGGKMFFSASDMCEYLNITSSFDNGVLMLTSYDDRYVRLDTYSSPDIKMLDSHAYISPEALRKLGVSVNYYTTANVYVINYTPTTTVSTNTRVSTTPKESLLRQIYKIDFTTANTKEKLSTAFMQALKQSNVKQQMSLRNALQHYVETLQGEITDPQASLLYMYTILTTADTEANINYCPKDVQYFVKQSKNNVRLHNDISDEQSIENIVQQKELKVNSKLYQVARLEATARQFAKEAALYRQMRDMLYLKIR